MRDKQIKGVHIMGYDNDLNIWFDIRKFNDGTLYVINHFITILGLGMVVSIVEDAMLEIGDVNVNVVNALNLY